MRATKRREQRVVLRSVYHQLVGKEFFIPANFFGIDVPGMYYRFRVVKKDNAHRNAMTVVSLEEKGPKNWIPVSLIKRWVDEDHHIGRKRRCTNEASDDYAVESLLKLKHAYDPKDLSDEESATTALLSMHETKKARRENSSRALPRTMTYDLTQWKGFLRLKSVGTYKVRLEGDDSEEESSKRPTTAATVMVHKT